MVQITPAAPASRAPSVRQTAVLDAIVAKFLKDGFRDVRLDQIAAAVQCSKSTLYLLADNKQQLVVRCVERFFRRAARHIDGQMRPQDCARIQLRIYLAAVAKELAPASELFLADVANDDMTRAIYERHTQIAAEHVRVLVQDGIDAGDFDPAHARFLGELAAAAMDAIARGRITARTGLSHAEAYHELANLVLAALGANHTAS